MKPNPMGTTFAERTAAARGDTSFDPPVADEATPVPNTTFAERAKMMRGAEAEDKAVRGGEAKSRRRRS